MDTYTNKNKNKMPDFINEQMNKKSLANLLAQMYLEYGGAKTADLANNIKNLGYKYATKAGVTISIADLSVPPVKKELLNEAEEEIAKSTTRYLKGEITEVERYTKVIDTWSETTAKLTENVVSNFDRQNSVYMMAFSGARGNLSQVSQLVGMRGLMADAQGQIIDLPIKSNFKEGLSVTEYIISSYGARKGLVDTALKTADSGYLTRRLVDVAQDVIVRDTDCGTENAINMKAITDGEKIIVPLVDRLLGRTVAEDIKDADGNVLVEKNTTMNRDDIRKISRLNLTELKVRSPLTCELEYGICQKCYGWAMTTQKTVDIGEAIGIIAAQSIGEPGTQLTMRTFHTGGAVAVKGAMKHVEASEDGEIISDVKSKLERTRHGDEFVFSITESNIELKTDKKTFKYHIPGHAKLLVKKGDKVVKGQLLAEYAPQSAVDSNRLTEKATKDITTDLSGEVRFEDFAADEKKDRQGNVSRTANKNGIIWVLGGDVYNLPSGSKILVEDKQKISTGENLAEINIASEHGGEVRVDDSLEIEEVKFEGKKIKKIVSGKELTIVIASIIPSNATFESTKKEQIWTVEETGEKYIVKSPIDTIVENGMIIAELMDNEHTVTTSGEIRYNGIEVDENQIITKAGEVIFIPDEIHQLSNKDSSLKMVETGTFVTAGTEVVKDLYVNMDGIVEIKEFNDCIHEVVVTPGEMYTLPSLNDLKVEEGELVEAGTVIAPKIKAKELSIVTIMDSDNEGIDLDDTAEDIDVAALDDEDISNRPVQILVRPVQKFRIEPKEVSINFESTDNAIDIVPVTQLQYKDGQRVRSFDGAALTRTSLVLQMQGYLGHLKGMVELDNNNNLKIVVLETLIIRREIEGQAKTLASMQTELLVENGQIIDSKTPVAKTRVLAISDGIVNINKDNPDVRRLLLVSENYEKKIPIKSKATVKVGEFIKMDSQIAEGGEKTETSGLVVDVAKTSVTIRTGRPYLISPGTMLQVGNGALVLRGDMIATLVFERQKTGDIVQGLPRVEELLEARKPKDSAIVAEFEGTAEIVVEDEVPSLYIVNDTGRHEIKYPIDASIVVNNGQKINAGDALTTGPMNPHDIIRLNGISAAQQYLVDEVQRVYRSQGVEINDKHIEIIVSQMLRKARIVSSGDTKFLPGNYVDILEFSEENRRVANEGLVPGKAKRILLGITKAALATDSFLSAASFQETSRVLTDAAIHNKIDPLNGLKENVIIGKLIPAGTGLKTYSSLTPQYSSLGEMEDYASDMDSSLDDFDDTDSLFSDEE